MPDPRYGRILEGTEAAIAAAYDCFEQQPVDREWMAPVPDAVPCQTTLQRAVSVTGPGTFFGRAQRTLRFEPTPIEGWWFDRTDLPESMPIRVSVHNVWTTVRNIVLCSGSPHNYMRMVEHIVALKNGLGIDNVMIRMDSGDPPLFDRGSLDLVEALDQGGCELTTRPVRYVTVSETVTLGTGSGGFLTLRPCRGPVPVLDLDCAVDFRSAIGQQRLRVRVTPETFRYGAQARTNCTFGQMVFTKTIGKLFADIRNLGYTTRNILVAGRRRYHNEPLMPHGGKSMEAVWHRAMLDLLAAIALIDSGRFVGEAISYKSGHSPDVIMVRHLFKQKLLVEFTPGVAVAGGQR